MLKELAVDPLVNKYKQVLVTKEEAKMRREGAYEVANQTIRDQNVKERHDGAPEPRSSRFIGLVRSVSQDACIWKLIYSDT